MRLLFLGIDCFSTHVVRQYPETMPFLMDLAAKGEQGVLLSTSAKDELVPHTGPSWATIYTGVGQEEHSITHGGWLLEHAGYNQIRTKTLWEALSEHLKVGLFTMPLTFPPPEVSGWVVTGFPSPSDLSQCVRPAEIEALLPEGFRTDYTDGNERENWRTNGIEHDVIRQVLDMKISGIRSILQQKPVDVLAFGITMIDRYHHAYPLYNNRALRRCGVHRATPEIKPVTGTIFQAVTGVIDHFLKPNQPLLDAYRALDERLASLVGDLDPEAIVAVSDHGAQKYVGQHDFKGYHFAVGAGVEPRHVTRSLEDCAAMTCELLGVPTSWIGEKVIREEQSDYEDHDAIARSLKGLGYL